jgi:predicted ATPase
MVRAANQPALEVGERLLRLAQRLQNEAFLLEAHGALSAIRLNLGQFGAALTHQERVLAGYKPQPSRSVGISQDLNVSCLAGAARALWCLGYPDQALARCQEAVAYAQRLAHPYSLAWSQSFVAEIHHWRGELLAARQMAEASLCLAMTQGFQAWIVRGRLVCGMVLARLGCIEEGIAQMQQGLEGMQATGATRARAYFLAYLARAYMHLGQPDAGLTYLTEALALIETTGERWWAAECHRIQGDLLLLQANLQGTGPGALHQHSEAEACFRRALAIARDQEAKSLELRATISLSRFWQQQGKQGAAQQALAAVYGWFTEGFDTADLQEAKVLREGLGG